MTALVLSGSYTETNRFAKQQGLGYGIRHVVSATNLNGRRPTSIHILPSYYDRRDIHAVKAAMKHVFRSVGRSVPVVDYDIVDGEYVARVDEEQVLLTQNMVDFLPGADAAPDESKDAVPGQTAIEEHIEAAEAPADDLPEWLR